MLRPMRLGSTPAFVVSATLLLGCRPTLHAATPAQAAAAPLSFAAYALPEAKAPISLDYIAYDRARARVWVPVGDTGSVEVFDIATRRFTSVRGFATALREKHGKRRTHGPSAVTLGDGYAYVGDRASSEVCAVKLDTLERADCAVLASPTDGVAYVADTREVWVTTPSAHSITILEASNPAKLAAKSSIAIDGEPEGYAVDAAHGLFYTNLEDKNRSLSFDLHTHALKSNWPSGCDDDGPRGVALDAARGLVFVACTNGLRVLDAAHDGKLLGRLDEEAGVDNIDYDSAKQLLYLAGGKSEHLLVVRIGEHGVPTIVASGTTPKGARNAVADDQGNVYVAVSTTAQLLVFAAAASATTARNATTP
jgi:DNA-binding beta-propeller fold protein YncE